MGSTLADKIKADNRFRDNMVRVVKTETKNRWIRKIRLWLAKKYYKAVKDCGGPAFWDNKVELKEVI